MEESTGLTMELLSVATCPCRRGGEGRRWVEKEKGHLSKEEEFKEDNRKKEECR